MRGEKLFHSQSCVWMVGSPPHARGKAVTTSSAVFLLRITPACAGKSFHQLNFRLIRQDHPRMRGEKLIAVVFVGVCLGSPPHARGKDTSYHYGRSCAGITPACAGKRNPVQQFAFFRTDHPRMRGEKAVIGVIGGFIVGSPPHARGKA